MLKPQTDMYIAGNDFDVAVFVKFSTSFKLNSAVGQNLMKNIKEKVIKNIDVKPER